MSDSFLLSQIVASCVDSINSGIHSSQMVDIYAAGASKFNASFAISPPLGVRDLAVLCVAEEKRRRMTGLTGNNSNNNTTKIASDNLVVGMAGEKIVVPPTSTSMTAATSTSTNPKCVQSNELLDKNLTLLEQIRGNIVGNADTNINVALMEEFRANCGEIVKNQPEDMAPMDLSMDWVTMTGRGGRAEKGSLKLCGV